MCDLKWVREYLTDEAAILAANDLVSSHLDDFCNSPFRSLSSLNMGKLQCIQNTLANCNKYTWASPILKQLHWLPVKFQCNWKTPTLAYSQWSSQLLWFFSWLPVEFRCIFKTATLVYKVLHIGHPSYFDHICLLIVGDKI